MPILGRAVSGFIFDIIPIIRIPKTPAKSCLMRNDIFKLSIEMKSVNNKNLNIRVKIPYILNFLENRWKLS